MDDIDKMIQFLSLAEDPSFVPAVWPRHEPQIVDGRKVYQMPYPVYDPAIDMLWHLCFMSTANIDPYAALPEDPPGTEDGPGLVSLFAGPEDLELASLDQIRRALMQCVRRERMCEGTVAEAFEKGWMLAVLHRLRKLRIALG